MIAEEAVAVLRAAFRVPDLEAATIRLYVAKLGAIPPKMLTSTVNAAIERCKFFPTIAELIELASGFTGARDGHLGLEEAWALVAGLSEDDSVVWTDEIAEAYRVASRVLPDRVGARMAFGAAYRRRLEQARQTGKHVRWWASLGWDVNRRAQAVEDAVALGRLSAPEARGLLPPGEPTAAEAPAGRSPGVDSLVGALVETLSTRQREEVRRRVEKERGA